MTGEKVLIVDDSAEIRALLESMLPHAGYETLSAGTGSEALGLILRARPDVLLVDLGLPDIGGLKILEQLNRDNTGIPVVIMTGYGSEGLAARALRLGALGYLIKPFTTEEVLVSVEKALAAGRLDQERARLAALVSRQERHLQVLSVLGRAITDGMDCDLLLQRIVEAARYMTQAERSWLGLRQGEAERFRVVAQGGAAGCTLQEFDPTAGAESLVPVLTQGTPLRTRAGPGAAIRLQVDYEAGALLQVPLVLPGAIMGLLSVDRRAGDVPFSAQDEHVLSILASYALLALERKRQAGQAAGVTQ